MNVAGAIRRARGLGAGLILFAAVGFGSGGTIALLAAGEGMSTIGYITWRAILGTLAVGLLAVGLLRAGLVDIPARRAVGRWDLGWVMVASVIGLVVNLAIYLAFSRVPIGVAMITFYVYPALVTLGAVRVYGEPIDRRRAAALAMGLAAWCWCSLPRSRAVDNRWTDSASAWRCWPRCCRPRTCC